MSTEAVTPEVPDMPAAARRPLRSRAPVPLEPLLARLQQIAAVGSNIFALMRRVMLLILQRVARAFNVHVEHQGLAEEGSAPDASFTGDPDFSEDVAAAANLATSELSAFVQDALTAGPDGAVARLSELKEKGGAVAYLSLTLDRVGQAMRKSQADIEAQERAMEERLADVAARLQLDPMKLRELLSTAHTTKVNMPEDPDVADLAGHFRRLEDARKQLVQLKVTFCDYCVAARQLDEEGEIGTVAKRKAQELGDPSLLEAVEMALAHRHNGKENLPKNHIANGESPLNLSDSSAMQPMEAKDALAQAKPPARQGFRKRAYFVVDEETREGADPDFDDAPSEPPRTRER